MDFKQFFEEKIAEFKRYPTKEEFLTNFKTVIDFCKEAVKILTQKIDDKLSQALSSLQKTDKQYQEVIKKIETENQSSFSNMKRWATEKVNELFVKYQIKEKINEIDAKLAEIKPIDEDRIVLQASTRALEAVKPLIPTIEPLKDKGGEIATILEDLPEEEKLKIEGIKGLQAELDELRKLKGRSFGGGGFSLMAMQQHFVYKKIPVDSGDHLNFTLDYLPSHAESFTLYRSRAVQNLTEDYTLSGRNLTLTVAFDATSESLYYDCQI